MALDNLNFIYRIPFFGNKLIGLLVKIQGGQKSSTVARALASKNNVYIGMYSYGFCFSKGFNLGGKVNIGNYCSIANNVRYFGANHPISNITTSPYFYNKNFGFVDNDVKRFSLNIGNDVWIGYGTIITSACESIGDGAIIGAGSIVTKNVEAYSIVAGNPAKQIRKRFTTNEIDALEKSKWWEYPPKTIVKYCAMMDNPLSFCASLKKEQK